MSEVSIFVRSALGALSSSVYNSHRGFPREGTQYLSTGMEITFSSWGAQLGPLEAEPHCSSKWMDLRKGHERGRHETGWQKCRLQFQDWKNRRASSSWDFSGSRIHLNRTQEWCILSSREKRSLLWSCGSSTDQPSLQRDLSEVWVLRRLLAADWALTPVCLSEPLGSGSQGLSAKCCFTYRVQQKGRNGDHRRERRTVLGQAGLWKSTRLQGSLLSAPTTGSAPRYLQVAEGKWRQLVLN